VIFPAGSGYICGAFFFAYHDNSGDKFVRGTYSAVIFGTEFAFTAGALVEVSTGGSVHK